MSTAFLLLRFFTGLVMACRLLVLFEIRLSIGTLFFPDVRLALHVVAVMRGGFGVVRTHDVRRVRLEALCLPFVPVWFAY